MKRILFLGFVFFLGFFVSRNEDLLKTSPESLMGNIVATDFQEKVGTILSQAKEKQEMVEQSVNQVSDSAQKIQTSFEQAKKAIDDFQKALDGVNEGVESIKEVF